MKIARYYEQEAEKVVRCTLCPHHCRLQPGQEGICLGRQNIDGTLIATSHERVTALAMDPIEKKPLYHFYPGRSILSTAANACNLKCQFCQNWQISQVKTRTDSLSAQELIATAQREGSIGIAYTYTEPLVWYEYLLEAGALAHEAGLKNVLVSNGYIEEPPLRELLPLTDAWNIDIKALDDNFYRTICKASLEPVLRTIQLVNASPAHLELTNLIIPGQNDSDQHFENLFAWIADLNEAIPLHLSAYHPSFQFETPRTPTKTLLKAYDLAKKRLKYVYLGNIALAGYADTNCPLCQHQLVRRQGYRISVDGIEHGHCRHCQAKVDLVGV